MADTFAALQEITHTVAAFRRQRLDLLPLTLATQKPSPALLQVETVRSAAEIADYVVKAGRRRSSNAPQRRLAAGLLLIWQPEVEADPAALLLERAIATIAAFLDDDTAGPYVSSLASEELRRFIGAGAGTTSRLTDLGDALRSSSGFQAARQASRATRPWLALAGTAALLRSTPEMVLPDTGGALKTADLLELIRNDRLPDIDVLPRVTSSSTGGKGAPAPSAPIYFDLDSIGLDLLQPSGAEGPPPNFHFSVDQDGDAVPEAVPAPPIDGGPVDITVWYGTNRQQQANGEIVSYRRNRDPLGTVSYGACVVRVPGSHRIGEIRPPLWRRVLGDDGALTLHATVPLTEDLFIQAARRALDSVQPQDRRILLYIHGYRSDFEGAALRTAQLAYDLRVPGIAAFFSWPSANTTLGYLTDGTSVEQSRDDFIRFLTTLRTMAGTDRIDVIAHSMGNDLLLRTVHELKHATDEARLRLGVVVLAAADVDATVFDQQGSEYPRVAAHTTLYASAHDRALETSGFLRRFQRAGYLPPAVVLPGIDTIDVNGVDLSLLGLAVNHEYYAHCEVVLRDVAALLGGAYQASARNGIEAVPASNGVPAHWKLVAPRRAVDEVAHVPSDPSAHHKTGNPLEPAGGIGP